MITLPIQTPLIVGAVKKKSKETDLPTLTSRKFTRCSKKPAKRNSEIKLKQATRLLNKTTALRNLKLSLQPCKLSNLSRQKSRNLFKRICKKFQVWSISENPRSRSNK